LTLSRRLRTQGGPLLRAWAGPLLLIALGLLVVACSSASSPGNAPGAANPTPSPTPVPTPLRPAPLTGDPIGILAWAFTPIFQALFIILMAAYKAVGDIGVAIIILTIVIRIPLIPLFRQQIVSMRYTQLLGPEVREVQRRFKGDRQRIMTETQALYRSYGISQFSGCLPLLLQMPLLFIMYQVIRDGLTNFDITPMLTVFGTKILDISCNAVPSANPCVTTTVAWLGGLDVGKPHVDVTIPLIAGIGVPISIIALVSAVLQVLQSRMTMPPLDPNNPDPNARITRQTMLFLPLIFIIYAGFLPAGLYIYYVATTVIAIVQQYFIVGFGSLFPLFGWEPAFARNHTPRFPVALPAPKEITRPAGAPPRGSASGRGASPERGSSPARSSDPASTVRPKQRGRQGRRGRRR
jgi:YidC/Oxa1 family membrane protein insertase